MFSAWEIFSKAIMSTYVSACYACR